MKKILLIFCLIITLAAAGGAYCYFANPLSKEASPNIVLIVSDALRSDVIGCYGGDDIRTPNIDYLASQGVLFENAYTSSPYTSSSSVGMFTGVFPGAYRKGNHASVALRQYEVPEDHFSIGDLFQSSHYFLLADIENIMVTRSALKGFKFLSAIYEIPLPQKLEIEQATGIKDLSDAYHKMYYSLKRLFNMPLKNQPFFFIKWILDPHSPYNPPEKFKETIPVDVSQLSEDPEYYSEHKLFKRTDICQWSPQEQIYLKELYKKEVETVDERLGFILKALKYRNVLDNTFIIFTSDHGELFGEKNQWGHGQNYFEKLVRVPLIVSGPGIPKGRKVPNLVSLIGLTPTIADILSLEIKGDIQGESFAKLLFKDSGRNQNIYVEQVGQDAFDDLDAYREDNYKLFLFKGGRRELYNIEKDPAELNDIATGNTDIIEKMIEKVKTLRADNLKRKAWFKDEPEVAMDQETVDNLRTLGYIQ
ncbi:MAG: sulfatase-like hydrolase/transferase [Desulfobacteraceae bacterium]|nr:sulfatase-like hydrolase/transferase [Desulfobacteraceae bacterium]